jgi:hypothetical protein
MSEAGHKRSILLYCDRSAFERLLDLFADVSLIDCKGQENEIVGEILENGKGVRKEKAGNGEDGLCYAVFDGFSDESLGNAIDTIRHYTGREWVFATTTESNLSWRMNELLIELTEEHNYFRKARQKKVE